MNERLLLENINSLSLSELTDLANKIINKLENEQLLKVNILIEKKFQKNSKEINEKTKLRIKEIKKDNEKKIK